MNKIYYCPYCATAFNCLSDRLTAAYCSACGSRIDMESAKKQLLSDSLLKKDKSLLINYALENGDACKLLLDRLSKEGSADVSLYLGVKRLEAFDFDGAINYFSSIVNVPDNAEVTESHIKAAALLAVAHYSKDKSESGCKKVVALMENVFRLYYKLREQKGKNMPSISFIGACRYVQENLATQYHLTNYTKY